MHATYNPVWTIKVTSLTIRRTHIRITGVQPRIGKISTFKKIVLTIL
jgi:hypothetical protein